MENEEFSSDTSDDDYVPTGVESEGDEASGDEEVDDGLNNEEEEEDSKNKKSKKHTKRRKGAKKKTEVSEEKAESVEPELTEEEKKQKLDNLWADFKKDVDTLSSSKPKVALAEKVVETKVITKEFEFAGEKIKVTQEVKVSPPPQESSSSSSLKRSAGPAPRRGGLSGLAGLLGAKKPKLSTLEKSKLDWDSFKKEEGIEEDLKTFNQGKQGFLERQAFLERADLKQFEIERSLRLGRKTNR